MRTARLVGPTADGTSMVLVTEDGEELVVPVDPGDPVLRSVLGTADSEPGAPHPGPTDRPPAAETPPAAPAPVRRPPRRRETPPMDTTLSPRDIQQRIRAGESLEDLVSSSGMDPERVERFAAPVLAEREHMARTALSGSVRRRGESSGHRPLRTVVAERLLGQGVDADDVSWDAWKREDGQWQVTADYELLEQERHAEFRFDPQGRFSLAEDNDARWLAGERPSPIAAVVDRDDELALVRATSGPGEATVRPHEGRTPGGTDDPHQSQGLEEPDDARADLEVTENLAAVLQVVPPVELSAEELDALVEADPELDLAAAYDAPDEPEDARDEDGADPGPAAASEPSRPDSDRPETAEPEDDRRARTRDEAAEPTIAVVRRLTQVTVEVETGDAAVADAEEARSALDTLYDMLGGDGYAEESTRVYAGLSDAAAVPVVDEHEFEPPAAVQVPADPGPEPERDEPAAEHEPALRDPKPAMATTPPSTAPDAPAAQVAPAARPAAEPVQVPLDEAEEPPSAQATDGEPLADAPAAEAPPVPDVDEPLIPAPGAPRKPGRRKRASVPSWDEIMFGGPKPG